MERRPHVAYVFSHPISADRLLHGQLAYLRARGFDVTVIASPGERLERVRDREGVEVIELPMERAIAPGKDARSLAALTALLRELEPDIVNAGTTKAGLLGMMAAALAGVPARVYVLRGLRLETQTGARRAILGLTEHVAAACAHRIFVNSPSLRDQFVSMGFAKLEKTTVLASGSSNGVDYARFEVTGERRAAARALADRLGIPDGARVVGFVGRLARDKGLPALLRAFERAAEGRDDVWLLVVGDFDEDDPSERSIVEAFRSHPRVIITGYVAEPAPYYALIDVLLFPSLREGFPNVPMEAACARIPTVGYAATGTVDAVVHGHTGSLVPIGDVEGLGAALRRYVDDEPLRAAHGRAAAERARHDFAQERVWKAIEREYRDLLARPRALFSIDLEDYEQLVGRDLGAPGWDRPNAAFERQLETLLSLLDEIRARATFFTLGVTAKNYPDVVREIARRGHTIASHGHAHRPVFGQTREQFHADVAQSVEVIEALTGRRPRGYRAPAFSLNRRCVWALEVLADLGFEYDSSQNDSPKIPERITPLEPRPFRMVLPSGRRMLEVPPAVATIGKLRVPIGGGSYWRVLPARVIAAGLDALARRAPPALYFHPYEFDPEPLRAPSAGAKGLIKAQLHSLRQNPGRARIARLLRDLSVRYTFQTYEEYVDEFGSGARSAALSGEGVLVRQPV